MSFLVVVVVVVPIVTKIMFALFFLSRMSSFSKKNLIHSYRRVNDSKSYALEHTFYEDLANKQFSSFLASYTFMGRSGSTGKTYDHDYPEEIRSLAESFVPEISEI